MAKDDPKQVNQPLLIAIGSRLRVEHSYLAFLMVIESTRGYTRQPLYGNRDHVIDLALYELAFRLCGRFDLSKQL
jgi:hypothetical protein